MKKLLLSVFSLLLFNGFVQAQAPQAFKYQAVVRDAGGQVLPDQQVGLFIELAGIDTIYSETHTAMTNSFGLVNLEIGRGTPVFGIFSEIDWNQQIYIVISLDATGGTNYETMGVSELLSVPFALHAANAGNSEDADADPANEIQTLIQSGVNVTLSQGGGTISVNDADADVTNEIQVLSQDGADVTLSKDGGTISVNDADADATNELEMPTDAQAGDIVYYDGDGWKKVPTGGSGQVLTLGDDGLPYWGGLISITLPNGDIVQFSPVDNYSDAGRAGVQWGPLTDITDLTNLNKSQAEMDYNGESNTTAIVAQLGDYTPAGSTFNSYAAKLCDDLVAYGYDDWYLPAAGELLFAATQTELGFGDGTFYLSSSEADVNRMWFFFQGSDGFGTYPPAIYVSINKVLSDLTSTNQISCRCARRN